MENQFLNTVMDGITYFFPLVNLITLLFLIWVTIETYRMRKGQDQTIKKNLDDEQPNIIVSFEEGKKFSHIYIEIENLGRQTAYDVKFTIEPKFDVKHHVFNKYINENKALAEGLQIFKGGKKLRIFAATTVSAKRFLENSEINKDYTFHVNYKNRSNSLFENSYKDSINKFFTRTNPDDKTGETTMLEEINKTLQAFSNKIPNLSNEKDDEI
ncbi:MAG: hypothetical protein M3R36_06000 [Bacteroidota bacterium]|nr:hypothetical protein [Bacteroidota bacterium]